MKRPAVWTMTVWALWAAGMPAAYAAGTATALCTVCALNGETEHEKVGASRVWEGNTYRFCSAKCAAAFDEDPGAYVFVSGPAPEITFVSLAGDTMSTSMWRGKYVLIDFWATWCKPCVKTMPELDALHRDPALDVVVIGISIDQGDDREKRVRKFLEKRPVDYPIVVDSLDDPSWRRLHVKVLPTLYVIDPRGMMISRHAGPLHIDDLRREIAASAGTDAD